MSPTKFLSERTAKWRVTTCVSLTLLMGLSATCSTSSEYIGRAVPRAIAKPLDAYVFTAAPDKSIAVAHQTYRPIAEYLSSVMGKQVVYRHLPDWRTYQQAMQQDEYDLIFDDSHFVSWRIARLEHEPLIRTARKDVFVVLASRRDKGLNLLQDLAGRPVCGRGTSHYATLQLYRKFNNPARQPILIHEPNWQAVYQAMVAGKCDAAIMSLNAYRHIDPDRRHARILFRSQVVPGPTLTAGSRLSAEEKTLIAHALLSSEGRKATKRLRKQLGTKQITLAIKSEYAGLDTVLQDVWGFSRSKDVDGTVTSLPN